ncbi:MAG: pyridoxal phosphate-dependent aminotransferase [Lachnospiraceae bacterium]|nr:pyridoxal phosphate-dependent aminotransferase [Lachnospiraceae bacterium]
MSLSLSVKGLAVKPSSTLAITAKAKELRAQGLDVVTFGAGEPDFDTPDNICTTAKDAIDRGFTKYTAAAGMPELRAAISRKFARVNKLNYAPEQIIVSNGGKHALTNVFQAIINPGDEVIIPSPYWLSYPEIVKLADGVPVFVPCDASENFKITPEKLAAACNEHTKALILNSPNNPTGMVYTRSELEALAKVIVEKDIYVVSDEIYECLVYEDIEQVSIASLGEEIYNHTITVNGVAKAYAMTGWRIGYTGAPKAVAKVMASIQSHQTSNPNSIAQYACIEAFDGPQESVELMHREFDRRRVYACERIAAMPYVQCVKPKGAFYVFINIGEVLGKKYKGETIETVDRLAKILIEDYLTAVIPCADFGRADHIRLSYAISMEQIAKGLDRISQFLAELN